MPYIIIGSIASFIIAVSLIGSYIAYRMTFYRGKNKVCDPYRNLERKAMQPYKDTTRELIRRVIDAEGESISTSSRDGLTLRGRYYHTRDNAPVMIQMHGYKSTPYSDFAGGFKIVKDAGMNLIHCEQRAHESSDGKTITFGIRECEDCLEWVRYTVSRFGENVKIILCGISMGAATVLMAAGREMPPNVVGVIADCPYSSPKEIILKVVREDMKLPAWLLYPFIKLGAVLYGRFNLTADSPAEAVKHAKVPILLFHGVSDKFVPCEMSEKLYENAKELISFHKFEGADHGMCYITDGDRYTKITNDFINSLDI